MKCNPVLNETRGTGRLSIEGSRVKESALKTAWHTVCLETHFNQGLTAIPTLIPHPPHNTATHAVRSWYWIFCLMLYAESRHRQTRWSHNSIWLRRGINMIEFSVFSVEAWLRNRNRVHLRLSALWKSLLEFYCTSHYYIQYPKKGGRRGMFLL